MKPLRLIISSVWLTFAVAVILLAVLLSAARLMLPVAGEYRGDVEAWVRDIVGQQVQIGALGASWHGWGPSVELRDVTLMDAAGQHPVLQCDSARIDINILASLREWQFEPGLLTVRGMHVSLVRREDGSIAVAGLGDAEQTAMDESSKGGFERWLQRQERLAIEDSSLLWRDLKAGGRTLKFTDVNLQLRNRGDRHRLDGTVNLPQSLGQRLELAMDVRGDLFSSQFWQGKVYARGKALRLGGWWGERPPLGLTAADGVVDFRVWSEWLNGAQQVEGDIHARDLHATRAVPSEGDGTGNGDAAAVGVEQVDIEAMSGGFHWQRQRPGWTLDVDNFTITRQGEAAQPAQLRVEYTQDDNTGGRDIRAAYSALRAEDLAGLLLEAGQVPAAWRERLSAMAPQGLLRDGYLEYHSAPSQAPHFVLRSDFDGLSTQPVARLPGVRGLTGKITADDQQGVVALAAKTAAVDFANLFRAPLPVDALAGNIAWRRDDKNLRLVAQEMTARNEDVKLQFSFRLDVPNKEGGSPYLDLNARFAEGKGDHVSRYLPAKIMGPRTVAWLDKAIVNGRVTGGTARIYGRLADFPFDKGNGLFEIRFDVVDGILEYATGWPRLEEIDAEVLFHGRRFEANATAAKSLKSEVLQARIVIPNMTAHPARVTVEGRARGPTADAVRYLTESPLRTKFGAYLDGITAGGTSRLQLSITLPLAKLPAHVKGALRIADGTLVFRDAGIDITHINGSLNFSDKGLAADAIHADLLGQPVIIGADTKAGRTGAVTTFSARGTADAAAMAKRFVPPLASYIDGTAPWQGELRIPPKREGWVELQVASSLKNVAVRLPSPMGKAADDTRDLLVQVPLPLRADKPVHIRYGDIADAQLALKGGKGGVTVARGEVRFGGGTAALSAQSGVRVVGTLPEFDEAQWSAILKAAMPGRPAAATAPVVTQVDLSFGELKLAGSKLDEARLQAKRGDDAWDVDINSNQAQGHIHLPDAIDAPLVMDMEHLYLERFKKGGSDESTADPRKLHPLAITAKHFRYGDLDLGELQLHASRVPGGLSFDDIHTHSVHRDMKVSGTWLENDKGQRSSFKLAYDGDDVGATLTDLNFAGVIKGGKVHTDLQLDWQGPPTAFALAKAKGSLSFEIKDGRLLDVEPGAGRVLGLLSFQALPRRLLLDFSDLFQKGFTFDTLAGSFTIEDGNAQTDNLHMDGPSAHIEAHGRVGLAAEDYDQRVIVIPNVTGGLPVAGAIAGGVGAGAALFLAEKLFKPGIDKMTRAEYRVTGPWANPTVKRITTAGQGKKPGG